MLFKVNEPPSSGGRLRLGYLDGLRGLAALYVVISHVSELCHGYATNYAATGYRAAGNWTPGRSADVRQLVKLSHFAGLGYGRLAVDVFIVLSGYCMMLPIARQQRDTITHGYASFLKRRAWRILPPYYIAIGFTLLLALVVPAMRTVVPSRPTEWDPCARGIFEWKTIVAHLLLIQNWGPWAIRIDGPMWSVAVEWQIYLLFPLLILPIRKHFGTAAGAVTTFAGGCLFYWGLRSFLALEKPEYAGYLGFLSPWFVGEFTFGVFAASLAFSNRPGEALLHRTIPWLKVSALFAVVLVLLELAGRKSWEHYAGFKYLRASAWGSSWVTDSVISLAVMCLIIHLTQQVLGMRPRGPMLRVLESPWAIRLGEFSYSLYLVHFPVIAACDACFRNVFGPAKTCIAAYAISLPLAVGLSYGFHLLFEKPFMTALQKSAGNFRTAGADLVDEKLGRSVPLTF